MDLSLTGKVALVTGAGTGLGTAIAQTFARQGARVIGCGRGDYDGHADWRQVDVRDWDAVDALVRDVVADYGSLDIMVNNAGVSATDGSSVEKPLENWHEIVDTNLDGCYFGCRAAIRQMLTQETRGVVINMSSRLALSGAVRAGRPMPPRRPGSRT